MRINSLAYIEMIIKPFYVEWFMLDNILSPKLLKENKYLFY